MEGTVNSMGQQGSSMGTGKELACCRNLCGWLEAAEGWCMGKELPGIWCRGAVLELLSCWRGSWREAWMEKYILGVMDGSSRMGNERKQLEQQLMGAVLDVSVGREVAGAGCGELVKQEHMSTCMGRETILVMQVKEQVVPLDQVLGQRGWWTGLVGLLVC